MSQINARYWWSEHLPLANAGLGRGYHRLKFKQTTVFCGYPFDKYIDPSEQEIDICDPEFSNFGFQKKKLIKSEILCCDRKKMLQSKVRVRKFKFYGRTVGCGTLGSLCTMFPAFCMKTFRTMYKNGFLPKENFTIGKEKFYFFEHLQAFAKVYNDLIIQGVFYPTPQKNPLHYAWLLKEWEKATKKVYDKPTDEELDLVSKVKDKELLKVVRDVVWE